MPAEEVRTCARCGVQATVEEGSLPQGWSMVTENKTLEFHCGECVRANIRAIEGKLPSEYWDV